MPVIEQITVFAGATKKDSALKKRSPRFS